MVYDTLGAVHQLPARLPLGTNRHLQVLKNPLVKSLDCDFSHCT